MICGGDEAKPHGGLWRCNSYSPSSAPLTQTLAQLPGSCQQVGDGATVRRR
jgi:hypothetical protein